MDEASSEDSSRAWLEDEGLQFLLVSRFPLPLGSETSQGGRQRQEATPYRRLLVFAARENALFPRGRGRFPRDHTNQLL